MLLTPDGSAGQVAVYGAMAAGNAWNAAGHKGPVFVTSGSAGGTVTVKEKNDLRDSAAGRASGCAGSSSAWIEFNVFHYSGNPTWAQNVGAHELGHQLGLGHDPYQDGIIATPSCPLVSLMYWSTAAYSDCGIVGPTNYDVTAVNKLYD